jgi:ABC-type antimicrobial peptide transport system permease subunit
MPTAGRLAASVAFMILGGYLAYLSIPLFDEGTAPGYWYPLSVAAGAVTGWIMVGARAGRGYSSAVGNGLTGVAAMIFWILFILCFVIMIGKSMRRNYDGPVEAVVNVFELILNEGQKLASAEVIGTALLGAVIAGIFAEFIARRLP